MIGALFVISGCSTVPVVIPKVTGSAIVVVRDAGFTGGGCTFAVFIDGEQAGTIDAGQNLIKQVQRGRHIVSIDNTSALCANLKMSRVVEISDLPGVFRIGMTSNFQVIFDQVE